jgi:hypothetical protein
MYLLTVRFRAPVRQNRPTAADANRGVIGVDACSDLASFRGPSEAREPGIHNHGPELWIPGPRFQRVPE